jgi:group I intron endonuclease
MEPSKRTKLSNIILDTPTERYCEIYKIVNLTTGKIYVGQAVSHILNHKKYRPYGCEGRFRCHISEAFSSKKNQSHFLNNAIRKYGIDDFVVELIECCEIDKSNEREIYYIKELNSLYPNGYNLKNGGSVFTHSDESKKRLSNGVLNYFKDKKFDRFKNIKKIDVNIEKYIKPLNRHNEQYGWYVYIDRCKADFGGVHIPLEESKKNAIEFIEKLRELVSNTTKLTGSSLEPLLPLTYGNVCEDLG